MGRRGSGRQRGGGMQHPRPPLGPAVWGAPCLAAGGDLFHDNKPSRATIVSPAGSLPAARHQLPRRACTQGGGRPAPGHVALRRRCRPAPPLAVGCCRRVQGNLLIVPAAFHVSPSLSHSYSPPAWQVRAIDIMTKHCMGDSPVRFQAGSLWRRRLAAPAAAGPAAAAGAIAAAGPADSASAAGPVADTHALRWLAASQVGGNPRAQTPPPACCCPSCLQVLSDQATNFTTG